MWGIYILLHDFQGTKLLTFTHTTKFSFVIFKRGRLQPSATFSFSFSCGLLSTFAQRVGWSTVNCQLSTDQLHAARSSQSSQRCREDGHHHLDDVPPEILVLHDDKQTLSVLRTSPPVDGESRPVCRAFCFKVNTWFEFSLGTF